MDQIINPQNLVLSSEQISVLTPYIVMLLGGMATLLIGVFSKGSTKSLATFSASIATILLAGVSVVNIWGEPSMLLFNNMMVGDYFSSLFNIILIVAAGMVLLSSYSYLEKQGINYPEYYSLILFSTLGMMLLAASLDLIVLFVSLEIMSISVYVLVGFRRQDVKSNEAALKYFILGSAASAILLFGIALFYGATATMNLDQFAAALKNPETRSMLISNPLFELSAILMIVGFLFKVATVPFHMWMPDVYEGAPTSVTNFMTTGLKAAVFASFLRVFLSLGIFTNMESALAIGFHNVLWVVAVITMFVGNVIALTQTNIKRMLAYSSVAHSGYILVGFIVGSRSEYGYASVVAYLAAYVMMNLGAFTIVSLLSDKGDRNSDLIDFSGLGFKHPVLGFAMAVFMFSMAGVPPTVGFAGKYLIFSSAVEAGEVTLAVLAVLCSAISAYYYLRVIVYMYMKDPVREGKMPLSLVVNAVIIIATIATLNFGMFPSLLIHAAKKAASF